MDKNKSNVPKIRFPGFTDPWEQRKLGEICEEFQSGKNIKAEAIKENGDYPVYGANGFRGYSETYNHDGIYALIGRQGALCGNMNISYGKAYFTEHAIAVRANKSSETRFLFYLLGKMNLGQYSGQSAQPGLAVNKLLRLSSSVPNYDEQKQISEFFVLIDNLITLHQRKLNHLQDKKKSLLQKMFPKNGKDFPELRFPGFTDPWEQCKLSELLFPADERNNAGKYTQDDVLAASLGTELVKKHIFFGLRSTEESVKNYRVVKLGDVIYTKSPIKGYPNGIIRTNKGLDGIVPSLYCVYHSIPSINSSIIQSYFEDKGRLDAYLYPLVNVGARNNVNITDLGFLEGTICISQDIDEQNKIVAFFNHLTNLIILHQRKLNHLQEQKKALLQQMFV